MARCAATLQQARQQRAAEAMPTRKVTRISAKACTDEPMAIDSARDQTTSYAIAQAPEQAKPTAASRAEGQLRHASSQLTALRCAAPCRTS